MRSMNQAHLQYVQYKQVDHHILLRGGGGGGGVINQKYFPMNESLLLLIYLAKIVSSL